jgi:5-methylcytosine-specific restriction endonuclease McrA
MSYRDIITSNGHTHTAFVPHGFIVRLFRGRSVICQPGDYESKWYDEQEEADRIAKEEADRNAKEEADRNAKEEADRIAKEKKEKEEEEEEEATDMSTFDETQTIVSELSFDCKTSCPITLFRIEEITEKMCQELSKLTLDKIKDKCKLLGIQVTSKSKKNELVELFMLEFEKTWITLKNYNKNELKDECKKLGIKGTTGLKKEEFLSLVIRYYSNNLLVKTGQQQRQPTTTVVTTPPPKEMTPVSRSSLMEEFEKQKQDIERKMAEEIERQQREEEKKKEKEKEKEKKKQAIPKNIRTIVWNHFIGEDIIKHRCLCCKKVLITNTNFEVGHVISEKSGGSHEINNLRPICGACNHSMGTTDMIEFVVKYGLYIG